MEKTCYTNKLNELETIMDNNKPSPFNNFIKVFCLTTMNMRYENVAFNSNIEEHPYVLTEKIINETILMYLNIMETNFIESSNKSIEQFKSRDLVAKHQSLWQEIWSRHNEKEFRKFIDLKAMRLKINDLCKFVEGENCIEFGCGNGSFSFALLEKGAKTVTGIDFGKKSVEYANNYVEANKLEPKAKFILKDVTDTGFPDEQFGFAVSNGVFHHLPENNIPIALKEVARVLKPGGWFWYYVDGEGAISMDLWDRTVKILRDIDITEIETHLFPLNISRQKMVHIMDSSNATYIHTNWDAVTELLSKCGFTNFRRLTGATDTDFDLDVVDSDKWGVEKFGSGDLRLICQKV
jgi:ubiquinone/menaquinone biosynthesis C-methylase UbiE